MWMPTDIKTQFQLLPSISYLGKYRFFGATSILIELLPFWEESIFCLNFPNSRRIWCCIFRNNEEKNYNLYYWKKVFVITSICVHSNCVICNALYVYKPNSKTDINCVHIPYNFMLIKIELLFIHLTITLIQAGSRRRFWHRRQITSQPTL